MSSEKKTLSSQANAKERSFISLSALGSLVTFGMTALLIASPISVRAQPAPFRHYKTLDTPHFRVNVATGLEREGRVAGAAAERAYSLLAKELKAPRGTIELTVTDDADYSNGYATSFPSNRIVIFAVPPVESNALRLNEDWLEIVVTHELTHIFHLDRVSGIWNVAQKIFGRAPALFPTAYGPSWLTEGLAVYYESKLTEGGRLKNAEHAILARSAAQADKFPALGELSLGSPVFPGGERAYAFGSLFVDYLARTQGDTGIGKFLDAQSRGWLPFRLGHQSERAFGITFNAAYEQFRDSITRGAGGVRPPVVGWQQLTTHPYFAQNPRWLNDSTLVYAANNGRSTTAAYQLSLDGERHRIGRRNGLGPSVPWLDKGLLFAQLEYESPDVIRSNLYVERNGKQRRLTKGMRLVQPDANAQGDIVAVQLSPARTSLRLLDSTARRGRILREAGPDETWSEPRWSPDGSAIAAVHRAHGGIFSIEVIDVASNVATILDQGRFQLSSPSWTNDGRSVLYSTEAFGAPMLARATRDSGVTHTFASDSGSTGAFTPEQSPSGNKLAVVALRADGYHVGIAPGPAGDRIPRAPLNSRRTPIAAADTQVLAQGEYREYSAWQTLLPRYWYPIIEQAPGSGYRLGGSTSGRDAVYRHIYDAALAIPTNGFFPTGHLTYRYAGLRRPYVDAQIAQDYLYEGSLTNGGTKDVVGTILRRTQTASLGASFVRPRARTFSALSVGAAFEYRSFRTDPEQFLKQLDTALGRSYSFPSAFISAQWSNLQRPRLSISAEDGISVGFTVRERLRADLPSTRSASVLATVSAFKSLNFPGFAHHVLAVRIAGAVADKRSASSFSVGGISGSTIQVVPGYVVGEGRRTFGVRGFPAGSMYGTKAAAGSVEYRAPLILPARGFGALPFFFDRASLSAFADAGGAGCVAAPMIAGVCAPNARLNQTIASVGSELVLQASVLDYDTPQSTRLGFAVPVAGKSVLPVSTVSFYLAYGLSF